MPEEKPTSPTFSTSCYSNRALLVRAFSYTLPRTGFVNGMRVLERESLFILLLVPI